MNSRYYALQAGGHWFESSIAHPDYQDLTEM